MKWQILEEFKVSLSQNSKRVISSNEDESQKDFPTLSSWNLLKLNAEGKQETGWKSRDSTLFSFPNLSLLKSSDFSKRDSIQEEGGQGSGGYNSLMIVCKSPFEELS